MHACQPRLDLATVAAAVGCSRCHLSRELNAMTGRPFSHHVREVRLREALMLMRNRQRSIKEIAAEVGYSSCTVFGRQFRAVMGLSPVTWRQISATHDEP
jgi:two-component system response regulator YesN